MMKRLMRLVIAAVLPIGMLLFGTASAQAQPVDCTTHVLDATVRQGIDKDFIARQIDALHKVAPTADVYVQAYEQLPVGYTDGFWQLCPNWRNASGDHAKENLVLVVYGRDLDLVNVYYGQYYEEAIAPYTSGMMNMSYANLGPERSQVDSGFLTSALVEPLISTPFYLKLSAHYSAADGTYHVPSITVDPGWQKDTAGLVRVLVVVLVGFALLGVIAMPLERFINKRVEKLSALRLSKD